MLRVPIVISIKERDPRRFRHIQPSIPSFALSPIRLSDNANPIEVVGNKITPSIGRTVIDNDHFHRLQRLFGDRVESAPD
jgi:hypothetical protein